MVGRHGGVTRPQPVAVVLRACARVGGRRRSCSPTEQVFGELVEDRTERVGPEPADVMGPLKDRLEHGCPPGKEIEIPRKSIRIMRSRVRKGSSPKCPCASGKPHLYQNSWACETVRGTAFTSLGWRRQRPHLSPDRGEGGTGQTDGAARTITPCSSEVMTNTRLRCNESVRRRWPGVTSASGRAAVPRSACAGWVLIRSSTSRR